MTNFFNTFILFTYWFGCFRSELQHMGSRVAACELLLVAMWGLAPWPGIKSGTPALGAQSRSHWTTSEVPAFSLFLLYDVTMMWHCIVYYDHCYWCEPRNHCREPPAGSGPGNMSSCHAGQTRPAVCHHANGSISPPSLCSRQAHTQWPVYFGISLPLDVSWGDWINFQKSHITCWVLSFWTVHCCSRNP